MLLDTLVRIPDSGFHLPMDILQLDACIADGLKALCLIAFEASADELADARGCFLRKRVKIELLVEHRTDGICCGLAFEWI